MVTSPTPSPPPIEPWFVGASVVGDDARIGFVYAPGRRHPSSSSPEWRRDLDVDLGALHQEHGVDVLISLMEPDEMEALGIAALPQRCRERGMEWIGFPIPDMSVPDDADAYDQLLAVIRARLSEGRIVVLHCLGGLGRSGTVAASVLVDLGMSADAAIAEVRRTRPGAIQTVCQEQLVRELEERRGEPGSAPSR